LKNAVARVNVYYEDLRYTEVDETPALTVSLLLGTLGGNIGLFLGKNSFGLVFTITFTKYLILRRVHSLHD
jgi:hypothetical protein